MESFEVPITQSPEMVKRLGDETYHTPEEALDELMQNAWDAGATFARITVNTTKIIFEDDGQGFNKERIIAFCTQGTDYKKKHPRIGFRNKAGNKGIGRYAVFKLSNICEVRTKIKEGTIYNWIMDNTKFFVGNKCEFFKNNILWAKNNNTGSEFLMTDLTESGEILLERIEKLKQLIIRNWDVSKIKVIVNGETLEHEDIEYEKKYRIDLDIKINGIPVKGTIGLATREGSVNGVLIKVRDRGVGRPKLFGIERTAKYGLLISRLRGVIHINSFADIVNVSRNDFIKTKKYEEVMSKIKSIIISDILEKKMQQQDKVKNSKLDKLFKSVIKDINEFLKQKFKEKKGVYADLGGDHEEDGEEEAYKLEDGDTRDGGHGGHSDKEEKGKDIIGVTTIRKSMTGHLKIGKYNWILRRGSEGSGNRLVVVNNIKREIIVNDDHPSFKVYYNEKNLKFLIIEVIHSATLDDEEFPNGKIRELIDDTMRQFLK